MRGVPRKRGMKMTALYILLGILAFFCLLLSSPLSLHFYYRSEPRLTLRVWGIPVRLLPSKPKKSAAAKRAASKPKKTSAARSEDSKTSSLLRELQETFTADGIGATLHWIGQLATLLQQTAGRLLHSLTVTRLHLELRIGGADAAAAAVHYGEVCATLYPMLALLRCHLRVKQQHITLQPDFAEAGSAALIDCHCRISLWRLTGTCLSLLWGIVRLYKDAKTDEEERTVSNE